MATNLDMLLDLKDSIFVEEILSKTRVGGLPWEQVAKSTYSVTICQPPVCSVPTMSGESWTLNVTKVYLAPDADYVYIIDVLVDLSTHLLSVDSRDYDTVAVLYDQIEKNVLRSKSLDRAIVFISNIPTSPNTDVSEFSMCGGASTAGGSARVNVYYNPELEYGGVNANGAATVVLSMYPSISSGIMGGSTATVQGLFKPSIASNGVKAGSTATVQALFKPSITSNGAVAAGSAA